MVLLTDNVEKRPLPPGDGAPRGPFEGPLAAQPRFLALLYHIIHSKSIGVRHSTVLTAKKHWKKAVLPGAAGRQQAALADGFRTAACFCGVCVRSPVPGRREKAAETDRSRHSPLFHSMLFPYFIRSAFHPQTAPCRTPAHCPASFSGRTAAPPLPGPPPAVGRGPERPSSR